LEVRISPIYAFLSLSSFNLFITNDDKTLFNSIKLDKVLRIAQKEQLIKFNCFDLVLNDFENSADLLHKGNVSLCADSNAEMNKWIETVQELKECRINVQNIDHNKKLIVDFDKINELLKTNSSGSSNSLNGAYDKNGSLNIIAQKNLLKSLYYNNSNKVINKSEVKVAKEHFFRKQVDKILGFMRRSNLKRSQIQRKMAGEMKEAKKFSEQIHQKQELIKKIVEQRILNAQRKEEDMIKIQHKSEEMELLKAVTHKIESMKTQELKSYSKSLRKEINKEKKKASEEASSMMSILVSTEKLQSYSTCTVPKLLLFEDKQYVTDTCFRYYGENVYIFFIVEIR
jgi:hypothetical protein